MSGPPPPPPPPPHGEAPKTTAGGGLPNGKYDIFIIPEHSAGSGFLYLPSMRTNTNSFIAGFASALIMVVLGQSMAPAFQAWWANFQGMGNAGMLLLVIAVGLGAWSLGRQSSDGPGNGGAAPGGGFYSGGGGTSSMPGSGGFSSAGSSPRGSHSGPPPNTHSSPGGPPPGADKPNGSYQRPPPQTEPETPPPKPPPQPQPETAKPQPESPKNTWEKAREEMRRKEEERKAKEADEKRRAEAAARLKELREKEARERAQREAERARREKEAKDKAEKEAKEKAAKEAKEKEQREAREKEIRERLVREREERRKKLEQERKRKEEEEAAASQARSSSSYAYSGVGEKLNPWPTGRPTTAPPPQAGTAAGKPPPSPTKKPPAPTARTFVGTEEDTHSYRPYDQPNRTSRRMSNSDQSESSWAPSQSTARTSPPPSVRGPYTTKSPDKIVIKAVYCFMNQFSKTPASQLISNVGSVTDGLILRITTEGIFIDDDVRGVAQREWDVKAWTLKSVEVWCPVRFLASAIAANLPPSPGGVSKKKPASASDFSTAFFAKTMGGSVRLRAAERGVPKPLTGDAADGYLTELLASCKDACRMGDCASKFPSSSDDASSVASDSTATTSTTASTNTAAQTGDWKAKGLHVLRATIRDQEGKRYLFVIGEEEGWKVAVGLQRLRKGTQVRGMGVAGMGALEARNTLEMLGWG